MEGPTPVSALIHAATMVAAGVYLVGRCYPLFAAEALLVIAYTGGITLFVAASIAVVMTDIKKVLAYSTVSQLGYMMLALGIGGWVAGLFHLMTHAFFKALLFLCSGSVIYGCHHEQEMTKMGGLFPKMKITALTMLVGVLTIAGIPLFSGWYSKDSIIAQAAGYAFVNRQHGLLFLLPLVTAGITTFYMFRMWFMTFTGEPRDKHVYEHAHESPRLMTIPLIILAVMSVCVAWGWPVWDATASQLEQTIHHAQPNAVLADFGRWCSPTPEHGEAGRSIAAKELEGVNERALRPQVPPPWPACSPWAWWRWASSSPALLYYFQAARPGRGEGAVPEAACVPGQQVVLRPSVQRDPGASVSDRGSGVPGVRPEVYRRRDPRGWPARPSSVARADGKFDNGFIDFLVNLVGRTAYDVGAWMRGLQTGYLRSYVLFLVLAAVGLFVALVVLREPWRRRG